MNYYILKDEPITEPIAEEDLRIRVESGEINRKHLVRFKGTEEWRTAGSVIGISEEDKPVELSDSMLEESGAIFKQIDPDSLCYDDGGIINTNLKGLSITDKYDDFTEKTTRLVKSYHGLSYVQCRGSSYWGPVVDAGIDSTVEGGRVVTMAHIHWRFNRSVPEGFTMQCSFYCDGEIEEVLLCGDDQDDGQVSLRIQADKASLKKICDIQKLKIRLHLNGASLIIPAPETNDFLSMCRDFYHRVYDRSCYAPFRKAKKPRVATLASKHNELARQALKKIPVPIFVKSDNPVFVVEPPSQLPRCDDETIINSNLDGLRIEDKCYSGSVPIVRIVGTDYGMESGGGLLLYSQDAYCSLQMHHGVLNVCARIWSEIEDGEVITRIKIDTDIGGEPSYLELATSFYTFRHDGNMSRTRCKKAIRADKASLRKICDIQKLEIDVSTSLGCITLTEPETDKFLLMCRDFYHKVFDRSCYSHISEETKTGCFVATCVYGDPNCYEVMALRKFRDNHLSNSTIGRRFISYYYKNGPSWAEFVREKESLKCLIRKTLDALILRLP